MDSFEALLCWMDAALVVFSAFFCKRVLINCWGTLIDACHAIQGTAINKTTPSVGKNGKSKCARAVRLRFVVLKLLL